MIKKAKEISMHDKDTGSSEVQIGLLTEKIENLSNFKDIVISSNLNGNDLFKSLSAKFNSSNKIHFKKNA